MNQAKPQREGAKSKKSRKYLRLKEIGHCEIQISPKIDCIPLKLLVILDILRVPYDIAHSSEHF